MAWRASASRLSALMLTAVVAMGCAGSDDNGPGSDLVAQADPAPAATAPPAADEAPTATSEPSPSPTPTPPPEPTAAPVASERLVAVSAAVLGLDLEPPTGLDDDQVAIRATVLGILDSSLPFESKLPFMENGELLRSAHDGFMAVIDGLAGQISLTEFDIVVDGNGDTASVRFDAEGPSIGIIPYDLSMRRVDGRWIMTQQSMCQAAEVSSVPCP